MENYQENRYVKRTQKDYSMSLKLQIELQIEQISITTIWHTKSWNLRLK